MSVESSAKEKRGLVVGTLSCLATSTQALRDSVDPYFVSKLEAESYYAGLPSNPVLVYRSGTTPWKPPTGPEAHLELKELRPVYNHKIATFWADLGPKVCDLLDSMRVTWTSVDVVRFAVVGKAPGPPVLWIGVMPQGPQSLSSEDAHTAAVGCQELLESYKITDVEIEFRESVFTRSTGPKLLESVSSTNVSASVRGPLTPALGLQIAAQATPYFEGTGALYISEGGNSDKVYILSARHVVFPPIEGNNELYDRTNVSQPCLGALMPGPKAFRTLLDSTMAKIGESKSLVDDYRKILKVGRDAEERRIAEDTLREEEATVKALDQFHDEITKCWSDEGQRILGHITYSPPIRARTGAEGYDEDWALIELDRSKIDWGTFKGNVIDLGTMIPSSEFSECMVPDPTVSTSFEYPAKRLMPLRGVIEEGELYRPLLIDQHDERYLMVIKNGRTTGVTIGRANSVKSYLREDLSDGTAVRSMGWAIVSYDQKSSVFSAPGDSGAIIVGGKGRIGGLIIGGTGSPTKSLDITFATPFYWLMKRIQTRFPNAHLYQPTA